MAESTYINGVWVEAGSGGSGASTHITVSTLPSYLKVDGVNVIDNGNSTWDIVDLSKDKSIKLSQITGVKESDFTYLDLTLTGDQISLPSVALTAADVGRTLAIKKAHHNPNTADGSEVIHTQLGRIITATVKITAVDVGAQTATISQSLNKTGVLRAYKYTNHFDQVQHAISLAHYFKIALVDIDAKGYTCTNHLHAELYTGQQGLNIASSISTLEIVASNEGVFKSTIETSCVAIDFYTVDAGNSSFTSSINIIPGDESTTVFSLGLVIANLGDASTSERDINLSNLNFKESDVDGNDAIYHDIVSSSGGGNGVQDPADRKWMNINIKDSDVRLKSGGVTVFNNLGPTTHVKMTDLDITRWSSNYRGENGRVGYFYDLPSVYNKYDCQWIFGDAISRQVLAVDTGFSSSVSSNVLTITNDNIWAIPDFDFSEIPINEMIAAGFTVEVELNEGSDVYYQVTSKISDTSLNVVGVPDGSYVDMKITQYKVAPAISVNVTNNVITVESTADFSWNDYAMGTLGRIFSVQLEEGGTEYVIKTKYNTVTADAKSLTSTDVSIPDGTYTFLKIYNDKIQYGHPSYIHPHLTIDCTRVKSAVDQFWWNSSGGKTNDFANSITFTDCDINLVAFTNNAKREADAVIKGGSVGLATTFYVNSLLMEDSNVTGDMTVNYLLDSKNNTSLPKGDVHLSTTYHSYNDVLSEINFLSVCKLHLEEWTFLKDKIFAPVGSELIYRRCKDYTYPPKNLNLIDGVHVQYIDCNPREQIEQITNGNIDMALYTPDNISFQNSHFGMWAAAKDNTAPVANSSKMKFHSIDDSEVVAATLPARVWGGVTSGYAGWHSFAPYPQYFEVAKSSVFSLPAGNFNCARLYLSSPTNVQYDQTGGNSMLAAYKGELKFIMTEEDQMNIFAFLRNRLDTGDTRQMCWSNLSVKTLKREIGEEVTFKVDSDNARLIEVSSSIPKKYTAAIPTRKGIDKERLYSSVKDGVFFENEIVIENLVDELYTIVPTTENTPNVSDGLFETANGTVMRTTEKYSVGQEFHGEQMTTFQFSIYLLGGEEVVFTNVGPTGKTYEQAEHIRHYWAFRSVDANTNERIIFVDNETGTFYMDANWASYTLQAADNLKINGNKVVSENWYRGWDRQGLEEVTTVERTAILTECRNGYEVLDTDLNTKFTKINGAWA